MTEMKRSFLKREKSGEGGNLYIKREGVRCFQRWCEELLLSTCMLESTV